MAAKRIYGYNDHPDPACKNGNIPEFADSACTYARESCIDDAKMNQIKLTVKENIISIIWFAYRGEPRYIAISCDIEDIGSIYVTIVDSC